MRGSILCPGLACLRTLLLVQGRQTAMHLRAGPLDVAEDINLVSLGQDLFSL